MVINKGATWSKKKGEKKEGRDRIKRYIMAFSHMIFFFFPNDMYLKS